MKFNDILTEEMYRASMDTGISLDLSEANLSGADLSEAHLSEANLSGAHLRWVKSGNNAEIKTLQLGVYAITICGPAASISIGCQAHPLSQWEDFSDDDISEMEGLKALEYWKENKEIILTIARREAMRYANI